MISEDKLRERSDSTCELCGQTEHLNVYTVSEAPEDHEAEIVESIGTYELKVQRITGTRGKVAIPYTTEEGTAKAGKDYEHVEGELFFCNEEYE